jgi:hypothetical protein
MIGSRIARTGPAFLLLAACCLTAGARLDAQKKFGIFGESKPSYTTYRDPAGRFEIDQPTKDWALVPPGGSAIAILARKDQTATLVIDLARLTEPLGQDEIATNAKIEVDSLKEQRADAKDFAVDMLDCKAGHGALIKYSRVGTHGAEKVLRYVIGVDRDLFRLDGVVQDSLAAKYEPMLRHMIESFRAPAGPAATKH